jgi:enterochelin esterase-like enzyme
MLSRRALLLGLVGLGAAGTGGLAVPRVRHAVRDLTDPTPVAPHQVPSGPAGATVEGAFDSRATGTRTGYVIAYPDHVRAGLPVLLVLHGKGCDHRDVVGSHRLGAFLSDAVRRGVPPFAVVGVDGGADSYWHARRDGTDSQRMVVEELLPVLAGRGLRVDRLALGGWSMGGYGALLLAELLGRSRVAAVAVDSPALWQRWQDSAPGAFDGRADFAAHDVLRDLARVGDVPLRVSCGTSDPFLPGVRALLQRRPETERELGPGGHDLAWWQHAAPAQLAFVGRHLAA